MTGSAPLLPHFIEVRAPGEGEADVHAALLEDPQESDLLVLRRERRPALFLDRDGVINERRLALVRRWEHFQFAPRALDALRLAAERDYPVLVVTNQDMVGAGYFTLEELVDTHARMIEEVEAAGGRIDAVYACIHPRWQPCPCRKPRAGMILVGAKRYRVDLERSWMVGDNAKDMHAGRAARTHTALVGPRLRTLLQGARRHADYVARDLLDAVEHAVEAMGPATPHDVARRPS